MATVAVATAEEEVVVAEEGAAVSSTRLTS